MKKRILLVAAIALVMSGGAATALDTATVTVSAIVPDTCRFNTTTATLAFGVLDPSTAPAVATSTNLSFWCTSGASYTITDDDGLYETAVDANRMQSTTLAVFEYIPYTITYNPTGTGLGPANPITLNITGNIAAGSYASNSGDVYEDTVTLTINP